MIIKISGADFSANNIGHIDIPIVIDTDIQQILSHYSRTLTDTQKMYFQTFYRGLQSNGLLTKITNLYLPILSSSVAEAMFNVKTSQSDASNTSNALYAIDSNHALYCSQNDSTVVTNPLSFPFSASKKNLHLMVYIAANFSIYTDSTSALLGAGSSWSDIIQIYYNGNTVGTGGTFNYMAMGSGTIVGTELSGMSVAKGSKMVSVDSAASVIFSADNKKKTVDASDKITSNDSFTKNVYPLLTYSKKSNTQPHAYAISAGGSLTASEMETYNSLLDAFINAITA